VDPSAGPKQVPQNAELPQNIAGAAVMTPRDLIFVREKDTAVISSQAPLTGPVVYEFRVAHK
jgi:hypothetical protein